MGLVAEWRLASLLRNSGAVAAIIGLHIYDRTIFKAGNSTLDSLITPFTWNTKVIENLWRGRRQVADNKCEFMLESSASGFKRRSLKSSAIQSALKLSKIRIAIEKVFSRPAQLRWYCKQVAVANLDPGGAVDDFFKRSEFFDVSPVRFFDPQWFRAKFPVTGVNAFLSYVTNDAQRLAPPSPLFAPRWYARQYRLFGPAIHPFLDYLTRGDERSPHPLLDVEYLRPQFASWNPGSIALEFLQNPARYRLRPHPLFDSGWYLEMNPDVIEAQMNPLEHYLFFGSIEQRPPNRFFSINWYRDEFLNPFRHRQATRIEPLTQYVSLGAARGNFPGPGLIALTKSSMPFSDHGPKLYCDCVTQNRNLYSQIVHRPEISPWEFNAYLFRTIERYNPAYAENMVLLRQKRIALMYSAKVASGKILYWWLEQAKLLDCALRFSVWSHEFEETFRVSREYIADGLTYDPDKYTTYKFVRHPILRTISTFVHMLMFPASFGLLPETRKYGISFLEFLDLLQNTDLMQRDGHCRPQLSAVEASGIVRPKLLKLEERLESHFAALERQHGLSPTTFEREPSIRKTLLIHTKQLRACVVAKPGDRIRFGQIPISKYFLTPETIERVYALYRGDFQAYGYERTI